MPAPLLLSRRFFPLFLVQALGALNDNLFKNALVVLAVFQPGAGGAGIVAAAGGIFILPYLLFSATAGQLADRFGKAGLIRWSKAAELLLMLAAIPALLGGNIPGLLAVLFGLGAQAAFFGPLKYGILPELLAPAELLRGNALVEAGTFAAILLGTIAGGALIGLAHGPAIVAGAGVATAAAGLLASGFVPPVAAAAPSLRLRPNIAAETLSLIRLARSRRPVWVAILGLSWFWALGATFLAQFPVLAQGPFHADNRLVTLLLAAFALGVGAGSLLTGRMGWSLRAVPGAAIALSGCTFAFVALADLPAAAAWHSPAAMLTAPSGLAAFAALVGASACGGVYSVPLYAALQSRSEPGTRARAVAANNVMNALFMVAGAIVIAAMAAAAWRPGTILAIAAALNLAAAAALRRHLLAADAPLRHDEA